MKTPLKYIHLRPTIHHAEVFCGRDIMNPRFDLVTEDIQIATCIHCLRAYGLAKDLEICRQQERMEFLMREKGYSLEDHTRQRMDSLLKQRQIFVNALRYYASDLNYERKMSRDQTGNYIRKPPPILTDQGSVAISTLINTGFAQDVRRAS